MKKVSPRHFGLNFFKRFLELKTLLIDTDPEYALAMKNADTAKVWQLENLFELQAEEIAIQTCLVM